MYVANWKSDKTKFRVKFILFDEKMIFRRCVFPAPVGSSKRNLGSSNFIGFFFFGEKKFVREKWKKRKSYRLVVLIERKGKG